MKKLKNFFLRKINLLNHFIIRLSPIFIPFFMIQIIIFYPHLKSYVKTTTIYLLTILIIFKIINKYLENKSKKNKIEIYYHTNYNNIEDCVYSKISSLTDKIISVSYTHLTLPTTMLV